MDLSNVIDLNYWAIIVAVLSTLVIGSLWYSPILFGKKWMDLNGFSEDDLEGHLPISLIFGTSFITYLLAAIAFAMFLGTSSTIGFGIFAGVIIAVFWISTSKLGFVLYAKQSFSLFLINASFDLICYVVMGAIIGGWQ